MTSYAILPPTTMSTLSPLRAILLLFICPWALAMHPQGQD